MDNRSTSATTRLIDTIVAQARETAALTGRGDFKASTLEALSSVDRAAFVDADQHHHAYHDRPLGIGHGQTISQPFVVALMTDLLDIDGDSMVLEVGTGSGYQAAILGRIARRVDSVEIIDELAKESAGRLQRLGLDNVHVHHANGRMGDADHAPFDAIMVSAGADTVPLALTNQLRFGGTLVIPVTDAPQAQMLKRMHKNAGGVISTTDILPVMFVPLTGHTTN